MRIQGVHKSHVTLAVPAAPGLPGAGQELPRRRCALAAGCRAWPRGAAALPVARRTHQRRKSGSTNRRVAREGTGRTLSSDCPANPLIPHTISLAAPSSCVSCVPVCCWHRRHRRYRTLECRPAAAAACGMRGKPGDARAVLLSSRPPAQHQARSFKHHIYPYGCLMSSLP